MQDISTFDSDPKDFGALQSILGNKPLICTFHITTSFASNSVTLYGFGNFDSVRHGVLRGYPFTSCIHASWTICLQTICPFNYSQNTEDAIRSSTVAARSDLWRFIISCSPLGSIVVNAVPFATTCNSFGDVFRGCVMPKTALVGFDICDRYVLISVPEKCVTDRTGIHLADGLSHARVFLYSWSTFSVCATDYMDYKVSSVRLSITERSPFPLSDYHLFCCSHILLRTVIASWLSHLPSLTNLTLCSLFLKRTSLMTYCHFLHLSCYVFMPSVDYRKELFGWFHKCSCTNHCWLLLCIVC